MADAFAPQFGGEVRFNQPIETPTAPSTGEALMGLAGGFLKAFGNAQDARADENKAREPSFTERQAMAKEKNLKEYTRKLSELKQQHESGDLTDAGFQIAISNFDRYSAGLGIDITSPEFDKVRTDITGLPSNMVGLTEDQIVINSLNASPEGQASLALARSVLLSQNPNQEPTDEQVVAHIKNIEAQKQEFENLNVRTELDLKRELPKFQSQVVAMGERYKGAMALLEANGIPIDTNPELLQNTYLDYQTQKAEIVNKIPAGVPDRDTYIKNLFYSTDSFFEGLGFKEGSFEPLSKGALSIKQKGLLAMELLAKDPEIAIQFADLGVFERGYDLSIGEIANIEKYLNQNGKGTLLAPSTPEWVTEAGVVVTNDMLTVATQLQSLNTEFMREYSAAEEVFKGVVGEDQYNNWASRSDEENWKTFQARAEIFGGFDPRRIRNGEIPVDTVYVNVAGMAISLGTVNTSEEAVSFAGIRSSVSAEIPGIIDAVEAADPTKGKALRTLWWLSTGKAARGYEAQITTAESANNIVFNPKTRTYNINTTTLTPNDIERSWLAGVVQKRYGGDIVKAVGDNFALLQESDAIDGYSLGESRTAAKSLSPDVEEIKRTLDLRNSFVYLDGLSRQIEPEEARVAREVMNKPLSEVTQSDIAGAATMEALATTPRPGEITQTELPDTEPTTGYRIPEEVAKDTEFVSAAGRLANDLNLPVDDIFRVIEFETAGSWSPSIKNPGSTATGLIQFLESTAKGLGTTTADLAGMTRGQQMEYVRRYLEPYKGRIRNFGDLYMAIHYPKAVGQSETFVMYSEGSAEYAANKNLDTNGDGTVTRGETVASVIARTGGGRGVMTTPATAQTETFVEQASQDITTAAPPGGFAPAAPVSMRPPAEAAPSAPVTSMAPPAEAALPEQIEQPQPSQAAQEEAARTAPPVDREVAALIEEIAGNPDKTYASERELLAAQQRGELEPGDTIIVDGVAYMVRKDGTPKRLGVVQE